MLKIPRAIEVRCPIPGGKAYILGKCKVIVCQELGLWHLSISHPTRYPTWGEIKYARYQFVPTNITMAMLLPPPDDYVNLHPNCFHLWEIEDPRERALLV